MSTSTFDMRLHWYTRMVHSIGHMTQAGRPNHGCDVQKHRPGDSHLQHGVCMPLFVFEEITRRSREHVLIPRLPSGIDVQTTIKQTGVSVPRPTKRTWTSFAKVIHLPVNVRPTVEEFPIRNASYIRDRGRNPL